MAEYFDRYRDFKRQDTSKTIDEPVIFLWQCTLSELITGFVFFVAGIYGFQVHPSLGVLGLGLAVAVPLVMRWLRQHLPHNALIQGLWFLGFMNSGLPPHLRRPDKYYLGP